MSKCEGFRGESFLACSRLLVTPKFLLFHDSQLYRFILCFHLHRVFFSACLPFSYRTSVIGFRTHLVEFHRGENGEKLLSRVRLFVTPWTVAYQAFPPRDFLGKNTGVGCHFLLQEIFSTQGLKLGLLHCRLYPFTVWATREVSNILSPSFFGWGQEYWSGLPFPSPRDLPGPGIEPRSPAL